MNRKCLFGALIYILSDYTSNEKYFFKGYGDAEYVERRAKLNAIAKAYKQ